MARKRANAFVPGGPGISGSLLLLAIALLFAPLQTQGAPGDLEIEMLTSGTAKTASSVEKEIVPTSGTEDGSADKAASQIVAPVGVPISSTEASTLGTTVAVPTAPKVQLSGDKLTLREGETTESLAIKSGAELLRRLNLVAPRSTERTGAREMDEPTTSAQLFDVADIRKMIGDHPTVVYRVIVDDVALPDPMIVPWVRNAKVVQERYDQAIDLLSQNNVAQGREELLSIVTEFPNTEFAQQAKEILTKIKGISEDTSAPLVIPKAPDKSAPVVIDITLNPNVKVSTVLVDPAHPEDNRTMINGRMYRPGQVVKEYPNHRVISITDDKVTIEVELSGHKKQFAVPVRPQNTNK